MPSAKRSRGNSTHKSDEISLLEESNIKTVFGPSLSQLVLEEIFPLLRGNRKPAYFPSYSEVDLPRILARVANASEETIREDIGQVVVPKVQNLVLRGETGLEAISDESGSIWSQCAKVGPKRSKPDFTAGLHPSAFSDELQSKLRRYGCQEQPFFFTRTTCFPFLTAEVKSGEQGLLKAQRQNVRHGAAAVGAILKLYKAAFGSYESLLEQPLFSSISHNQEDIKIFAHFAVAEGSGQSIKFCHDLIKSYNLRFNNNAECFGCYNFVYNIYKVFVPRHLERINTAARALKQRQGIRHQALAYDISAQSSQDNAESIQDSQTTELDEDELAVQEVSPSTQVLIIRITELEKRLRHESETGKQELNQQRQDDQARFDQQRQEDQERFDRLRREDQERFDQQRRDDQARYDQEKTQAAQREKERYEELKDLLTPKS